MSLEQVEQVTGLRQAKYFDLNVRHFHERLRKGEGLDLSRKTLRRPLSG